MAWSGAERDEGGYATASAIVVSLAIAMIASAVAGLSAAELKTARADLARLKTEYDLDGAQQAAVIAVLKSGQAARLRWSLPAQGGEVDVLAEPEAAKTGYAAASKLTDGQLGQLGVVDPAAVREKLGAEGGPAGTSPIQDMDTAPLWQDCAASLLSRFGRMDKLGLARAQAPVSRRFGWRTGDVWRIRTTSPNGWSDDRLVRFTGDARHPAAVIERRFSRQGGEDRQCDTLFALG